MIKFVCIEGDSYRTEKDHVTLCPSYLVYDGDTLVGRVDKHIITTYRKCGRLISRTFHPTEWRGYLADAQGNIERHTQRHEDEFGYSRKIVAERLIRAKAVGVGGKK